MPIKLTSKQIEIKSPDECGYRARNVHNKIIGFLQEAFESSYRTFSAESRPKKYATSYLTPHFAEFEYEVGATGAIYALLDEGAKKHDIDVPVGGAGMRFPTGYRAKTGDGLYARPGGTFGPYIKDPVFHVDHPGFEGRDFALLVLEEIDYVLEDAYLPDIAEAIAKDILDL